VEEYKTFLLKNPPRLLFIKLARQSLDFALLNQETRNRVKTWCQFTWSSQKSFDERDILQYLPAKMMTGKLTDLLKGLGHETELRHLNKTDICDSPRPNKNFSTKPRKKALNILSCIQGPVKLGKQ
jgi:hypothetical protein